MSITVKKDYCKAQEGTFSRPKSSILFSQGLSIILILARSSQQNKQTSETFRPKFPTQKTARQNWDPGNQQQPVNNRRLTQSWGTMKNRPKESISNYTDMVAIMEERFNMFFVKKGGCLRASSKN